MESLFNRIIGCYPETISLADTKMYKNGGATIPMLIQLHDEVEEKFENSDEERGMDWAIFTALHLKARECINAGNAELSTNQINYQDALRIYEDNSK